MRSEKLSSLALITLFVGIFLAVAPLSHLEASGNSAKLAGSAGQAAPAEVGPGYPRVQAPSIEALRGDPDIIIVDNVNYTTANTVDGSSINWVTGAICDCDTNPGFHFNPWSSGGNLSFWWWNGTDDRAGVSLDGTTYAVLGEGDTIGPASTFISAGFPTATPNWRQADDVDGYLGFRFNNGGTVNYGYVRLTTTGITGHPATIVSYAYNQVGGPITIPASGPAIAVTPDSFGFTLEEGDSDDGTLQISNVGSGILDWEIEFEPSQLSPRSHDPALDEVLSIPDFTVVSPANGGGPQQFSIPAGILTSGAVVGFSFEGTVSGISGSSDWASDLCMQIEGPDGSSFSVGGISGTIPNCNVNNWDFQGGGSTDDGTYASVHDDIWAFPPGAADDGDWSFTFIHGWNSTSANPMDWTDVTVTLHKMVPPEPCDFPAAVSWLSVDSSSGSTAGGESDSVTVTVDSDGLAVGDYSANLCITSNDEAGNELVVVPVELTVEPSTSFAEIDVSPASLSAIVEDGDSAQLALSIANLGNVELNWSIDEAPAAVHPRAHFPAVPWASGRAGGEASIWAEQADPTLLSKLESEARSIQSPFWSGRGIVDPVPAFTTTGFSRSDYVSLDALVPGSLTSILDPGPGTIFAQTFIDDDFDQHFFIATGGGALPQNAYGFVDTSTGVVNQLGILTGVPATGTWVSVAWDPSSGNVYGVIVPGGGNNQLFEIDVDAGTGTLVGTVSGLVAGGIIIAIAIDSNGLMYGLEIIDDVLVAIDKTDAVGSVIGPVGVNANFAQDMDFDRSSDTLYWASYLGGGNSNIRIIDTDTGGTTVVGPIQDGAELLSFSIAVAGASGCNAPEDVPWLSVDANSGSIQPGDPADVVLVTLDSDGLALGTYNALLCVTSNDPATPLVEVPVELRVIVDPLFSDRFESP